MKKKLLSVRAHTLTDNLAKMITRDRTKCGINAIEQSLFLFYFCLLFWIVYLKQSYGMLISCHFNLTNT